MAIGDDDPKYVVTVVEVSTKVAARGGADSVADELGSLSLSEAPVVFEAEWRTKVQFDTGVAGKKAAGTSTSVSSLFRIS